MTERRQFSFGTKAETLAALKPVVTTATVPDLTLFSVGDWVVGRDRVLADIAAQFGARSLVVRSSAMSEDQAESSLAGYFHSVLAIPADQPEALARAIDEVVASMTGNPRDQVLVQEMIGNVGVSGVIMTFDVARGAPYYCIDFDDETGRTDVVTSGSGAHKSLYVHRDADRSFIRSERVAAFLDLARELEAICEVPAIDIEFGMDDAGRLYLFQVRRIVLARNWHPVIERRVRRQLAHVEDFLAARSRRRDGLLGARTIFAIMPDWNPAEIIGTTPRPLAASLYRTLVTDGVWARARAAMGYRALGEVDLMVVIARHPYIDVRNSFNSFLPADLPDAIGDRLIDAWLDRLEAFPEFHDKVEFEIVPTCLDFTFEEEFRARYPDLLSPEDLQLYRDGLRRLTREALVPGEGNTLRVALRTSERLNHLSLAPVTSANGYADLDRARTLLSCCRDLGTFPFAIAARHAFIAETLLRSALRRGALSADRFNAFKRTIRTISGTMLEDYAGVCRGAVEPEVFQAKYGHLRPGTYEITSLRYDERDDLFRDELALGGLDGGSQFDLTPKEASAIEALLAEAGLDVLSADQLLSHVAQAIAARENVKFEFTRTLSNAMSHILAWGTHHGLSRDDLSYLEWPEIAALLSSPILDDLDRHFLEIAHDRKRDMATAQTLKFAHIISHPRDIYVATLNRSVPNFIGLGSASGPVVQLEANSPSTLSLEGSITCIENADPGFDWIFTKSPAALVTRFGGANSHMAVRCAELGIPAAIGCGDQIFERISRAARAELNCSERILRPLHG